MLASGRSEEGADGLPVRLARAQHRHLFDGEHSLGGLRTEARAQPSSEIRKDGRMSCVGLRERGGAWRIMQDDGSHAGLSPFFIWHSYDDCLGHLWELKQGSFDGGRVNLETTRNDDVVETADDLQAQRRFGVRWGLRRMELSRTWYHLKICR